MKKSKISKNMLTRVLSMCMLFALSIGGSVVLMAEDAGENSEYSFYRFSSAASGYLDAASNPNDDACGFGVIEGKSESCSARLEANQSIDMTNVGGALGFLDRSYEGRNYGVTAVFGSKTSRYSANRDGSAAIDDGSASGDNSNAAVSDYIRYGLALQELGIDDQAITWGTNLYWLGRELMGFIALVVYTIGTLVSSLFGALILILQQLNIFHMFYGALNGGDAVANGIGAGAFGSTSDLPQSLQDIASGFSRVYAMLYDAAIILIIPLTIVFIALGMIVLDHESSSHNVRDQGGRMKKVLFGIVFVIIGIPLLGFAYTAVLDGIADNSTVDDGVSPLDSLVYSEFVNFDAWTQTGLALPDDVSIVYNYDKERIESFTVDGKENDYPGLANSINNLVDDDYKSESEEDGFISDIYKTNAFSYIDGYRSGKKTAPIEFASEGRDVSCVMESFDAWVGDFNAEQLLKGQGVIDTSKFSSDCFSDYDLVATQPLFVSGGEGQPDLFTNNGGSGIVAEVDTEANTVTYTGDGTNGLSTLSMYNYLATSFRDDSAVVYSTNKYDDLGHRSYTAIGTGITQLVYLLAFIVSVGASCVFTLIILRNMLFNNIARSVKLLMAIPFAMTTAFQVVMKVIAITLVMILELILGYVVWEVGNAFILAAPTILTDPINTIVITVSGSSSIAITLIVVLISTIATALLTKVFAKVYNSVIDLLEEFIDNIVKRLGGEAHATGGGVDAAAHESMADKAKDKVFGKEDPSTGRRDYTGGSGRGQLGKARKNAEKLGSLGKSAGGKALDGVKEKANKHNANDKNSAATPEEKLANEPNPMSEEGKESLENAELKGGVSGTYTDADKNEQEGDALEHNGYGELLTDDDGQAQLASNGEGVYSENEYGGTPLTDADGNVMEGDGGEPLYTNMEDGSYAVDPETGAAMVGEDGEPIKGIKDENDPTGVATNADGSVISPENDSGGQLQMDEDGNPMKDSKGDAIYDVDENGGSMKKGSAVDGNGNPVETKDGMAVDGNGDPIRSENEYKSPPVKDPVTGAYQLDGNGDPIHKVMNKAGGKPVKKKDYIDPKTGEVNKKYLDNNGKPKESAYHMNPKTGKPVLSKLEDGRKPTFNKVGDFTGYRKPKEPQQNNNASNNKTPNTKKPPL